jgi:hypothetical protein
VNVKLHETATHGSTSTNPELTHPPHVDAFVALYLYHSVTFFNPLGPVSDAVPVIVCGEEVFQYGDIALTEDVGDTVSYPHFVSFPVNVSWFVALS